jgi:hypothetical protein
MPFSRKRPINQNISSERLANLFFTSEDGKYPRNTILLSKSQN